MAASESGKVHVILKSINTEEKPEIKVLKCGS